MLTAIANRLWAAEQPLHFLGLPIFSRMTVMALPNIVNHHSYDRYWESLQAADNVC